MSGLTNSERKARKEADRKFREALTQYPSFGYGTTALPGVKGEVQIVKEYMTSHGVALVHKVRIVADGVTMHAYAGLNVIPVDDDTGVQPVKVMDASGEIEYPTYVHSVRFEDTTT